MGVSLLFIFAGADEQVPTRESVEALERLQTEGMLQGATIRVFGGASHTFVRSLWRAAFAEGYLDLIGDWASDQVREEAAEPGEWAPPGGR